MIFHQHIAEDIIVIPSVLFRVTPTGKELIRSREFSQGGMRFEYHRGDTKIVALP